MYVYSKMITAGSLVNIHQHTELNFFSPDENFKDYYSQQLCFVKQEK